MLNWKLFINLADEFIISYISSPILYTSTSKYFNLGHSLELYFKAVYVYQTNNSKEVLRFSHNISELFFECKNNDTLFIPDYDLKKNILSKDFISSDSNWSDQVSKEDYQHFLQNQSLYIIAKYLADLKYFGTIMKKHKTGEAAFTFEHPDTYCAELIHQIRKYLDFNLEGKINWWLEAESKKMPLSTIKFLEKIIEKA